MGYLKVYDSFETAFTGNGIAVLEKASKVRIREVINGEYLLSLILPRNDPKWQYIQEENFIKVYHASQKKDQIFRIKTFDEIRDEEGRLTSNIQCEHVYTDAVDSKHIPSMEMIGVAPETVLEEAYSGTRFTIGTVEITTPTDIIMSKTNPMAVTTKLIENVGGELIKDNWTIHLVAKRGSDKGVQFRYGKNNKSLKRHTEGKNIITRLYPYGKDDLPLDGDPYIDSPLIGHYDRPKVGHIDYKDIEDPDELLQAALKEWSTLELDGIDKPKVTYAGSVLELKKLKEYGDIENFAIGDAVRLMDEGLEVDTKQRIMEYNEYPYEAEQSDVGLGNMVVKDYTNYACTRNTSSAYKLSRMMSSQRTVEKVTTGLGELDPNWFENIQEKLKTFFNGSLKKAVMHKHGDIWVDDPKNPTKAMAIISDGFAIANEKDENNDWIWRTFGTADGFTADLITGGTIIGIVFKTAPDGTRIEITEGGIKSYNAANQLHGLVFDPAAPYANFSLYYNGVEYFGIQRMADASGMVISAFGHMILGYNNSSQLTMPFGEWDFTSAIGVSGLDSQGYATKEFVGGKIDEVKAWVETNYEPKI